MLRFLSLTVEDFGPYKNRQTIDFTSDDGVTIIWGNNGRGKTTLLNAFRYALFGKVYGRNTKIQHSLQKISNWESFDEGKYGFKVILKMDSDGVVYELTRQYTVRPDVSIPLSDNDYKEMYF
jgi:DNA sulfur modification protein DndD